MSYYWDPRFLKHITGKVQIVIEAGARYGDESLMLSNTFKDARVFSFECNPITVEKCSETLKNNPNITFTPKGLGERNEILPFYSYIADNDGASSFLKRIDVETTQIQSGIFEVIRLSDFAEENNITAGIDLLCMDVQGFELNVLKGCSSDLIKKIRYVIMEEPKAIINTDYLPENVHSKYMNSPTSAEIKSFMTENDFIEVERIEENKIEDNVMYKNLRC
jgi:FkbM family methyltransferase